MAQNFLKSFFSSKSNSKSSSDQSIEAAINQLKETEERLNKQQDFLESQIENEKGNALCFLKQGNKRAAMQAMKKKKRYELRQVQVDGTLTTLELQREQLENSRTNVEVIDVMRTAAGAMKKLNKDVNPEDIDDLVDKINEQKEIVDNVNTILSSGATQVGEYINEDDLEAELMKLQADIDEKNNEFPIVPNHRVSQKHEQNNAAEKQLADMFN